jgi:sigma-E factor negative regulatory protein RseB
MLAMTSAVSADTGEQEAAAWIEKMVAAAGALAYEGTFVYLHGSQLESMRVIHSVRDGQAREHLISLNGSAREVIRDQGAVICILPDAKAVSVSESGIKQSFSTVLPISLAGLSDYYDFHMRGEARVAGRLTKVLVIVPKDAYRYGYRLFLDAEHALPLKTEMLNGLGMAVTQTMFTSLRVDPTIEVTSSIESLKQQGYAWIHEEDAGSHPVTGEASWYFKYLPAGFQLHASAQHPDQVGKGDIEHFILSDGLATLSVYVEESVAQGGLQGESRMGAINAFGTQVAGHQVTVVGEVPAQTVQYIAGAIAYRAPAGADQ